MSSPVRGAASCSGRRQHGTRRRKSQWAFGSAGADPSGGGGRCCAAPRGSLLLIWRRRACEGSAGPGGAGGAGRPGGAC
eukprot:6328958-Alexandrium_andersonii.AAC.1